jgi:threonine dehydrogenase-like Zn-dependent dehydrogenase
MTNKSDDNLIKYQPPTIITYDEDAILDIIGVANTCGSDMHEPHGHAWGWHKK